MTRRVCTLGCFLPRQSEKQLLHPLCLRHQLAVSDALSPDQKAELILDPGRDASEDEAVVREVFNSLTELQRREQLDAFFQAFAKINKQVNA